MKRECKGNWIKNLFCGKARNTFHRLSLFVTLVRVGLHAAHESGSSALN
jgi:hypothetical protein